MAPPSDEPAFGLVHRTLRVAGVVLFFTISSLSIYFTQLFAFPLKFFAPDLAHAWVDFTKQLFGFLLVSVSQAFTPCRVHISGDASIDGVFSVDPATGRLITKTGDRAIVISNHQLYSDWVYLWWIAFTARAHGGVYIFLKESLKWIPIIGWGMQTYKFIFLSRKWATDEKVLSENLDRINTESNWPAWLILFPEGTTFSRNGVKKSKAYGEKVNLDVPKHLLLPHSRGFRYSLERLSPSIEYVYDATIHYSGIPDGIYGEDYYTLRKLYLHGHWPSTVSMYWQKIAVKDIPYQDEAEFDEWLLKLWRKKDALLDNFKTTGSFVPKSTVEAKADSEIVTPKESPAVIDVPVKLNSLFELFQMFTVPLNVIIITNLLVRHLGILLSPSKADYHSDL